MTSAGKPHLALIQDRLEHLARMQGYLAYSLTKVGEIAPRIGLQVLSPEDHESLAAFRVRFSDFQEHLGKTMRAVALEESLDVDRFVPAGTDWAHFDTFSWRPAPKPGRPKGGAALGLRAAFRMLRTRYGSG